MVYSMTTANPYEMTIAALTRIEQSLQTRLTVLTETFTTVIQNCPQPSQHTLSTANYAERAALENTLKQVREEITRAILQRNAAGFGPAKEE